MEEIGKSWLMAGALLGCLLSSAQAPANSRYPHAQLLLTDPSNPNRLWLRSTYGVLTSTDRGCTWHWVCEQALGYQGIQDPMIGVMADGSVIGGVFTGLVTSRDHGCTWSYEGPLQNRNVEDLAVRQARLRARDRPDLEWGQYWTLSESSVGATDSARTWVPLGQSPAEDVLFLTIDTVPPDRRRIYLTGIRYVVTDGGLEQGNAVLFRSDDSGQTWQTKDIPGGPEGFHPYLTAVHPNDPLKIYVRMRGQDDPVEIVNRVIYSPDGGETWHQIFEARADVLGFALSPDGSRVLLGLGNPRLSTRPVAFGMLGLYAASTTDHRFELNRPGARRMSDLDQRLASTFVGRFPVHRTV